MREKLLQLGRRLMTLYIGSHLYFISTSFLIFNMLIAIFVPHVLEDMVDSLCFFIDTILKINSQQRLLLYLIKVVFDFLNDLKRGYCQHSYLMETLGTHVTLHPVRYLNFRYPVAHLKLSAKDLDILVHVWMSSDPRPRFLGYIQPRFLSNLFLGLISSKKINIFNIYEQVITSCLISEFQVCNRTS